MTHVFSERWPRNQAQAEEKWESILAMVKEKTPFTEKWGWYLPPRVIIVTDPCGYCSEFRQGSKKCPLSHDNTCSCFSSNNSEEASQLTLFLRGMKEKDVDWASVEKLASSILERIKQDRPPK